MKDVIIRKVDNTYMQIDADEGFMRSLSEYYSFYADNYIWHPKFKAGFWDGKIRLLNPRYGVLYSGLLANLKKFLDSQEKTYELDGFPEEFEAKVIKDDFENFLSTINLPDGFDIRDFQLEAILLSIKDRRGLIISPTGSGKSFIIYAIIRYLIARHLSKKILLLVPTINLVTQMYSDFEEYSVNDDWDHKDYCHKVFGGQDKDSNKKIIISTWQSIYEIKDKKYFSKFDSMFVDEVHTAEGKSITSIVERLVNAEYKFGFTGTLKETNINPLQLIGLFGDIHTTKTTRELIDAGILTDTPVLALILEYSEKEKKEFREYIAKEKEKTKKYNKELNYIYAHKKRAHVILKLAEKFDKEGSNTLLLFRKVDHCQNTFDMLKKAGYDCYQIKSSMGAEERERIRKYAEHNKKVFILSTYQIFQLGINIKNLHNGIFCAPSKGRIRILQSFGRLVRIASDGKVGVLVDLIDDLRYDDKSNYCYEHAIQRLKYYNEEELNVKYKKVKL